MVTGQIFAATLRSCSTSSLRPVVIKNSIAINAKYNWLKCFKNDITNRVKSPALWPMNLKVLTP